MKNEWEYLSTRYKMGGRVMRYDLDLESELDKCKQVGLYGLDKLLRSGLSKSRWSLWFDKRIKKDLFL